MLRATIDANGRVTEAKVACSVLPGLFDETAIRAAKQWRFEPAKRKGKPRIVRDFPVQVVFQADPSARLDPSAQCAEFRSREEQDGDGEKEQLTPLHPRKAPFYPAAADAARIEGTVVIRMTVDKKGRVVDPRVVCSYPKLVFDSSALNAVKQWTYAPPGESKEAQVIVNYQLPKTKAGPSTCSLSAFQGAYNYAGTLPPRAKTQQSPVYPQTALDQSIEGYVVLVVSIDERGRVRDLKVGCSNPKGMFDQAALDAVRNWTYHPATLDGKPVSVSAVALVVEFKMEEEATEPDGN